MSIYPASNASERGRLRLAPPAEGATQAPIIVVSVQDPQAAHQGSSFAVSFLFLPQPKREAMGRLYAFCHVLDEVSDGPRPSEEKKQQLEFWRQELDRCYRGTASHPITTALQETIKKFQLTRNHFDELLEGIEMDLTLSRYQNFVHLSQYSYRVAGTVGLICLEIFGCPKNHCGDYAIALGLAFQITNILRDIKEDARRGRIYLPQDDLRRFGYTEAELMAHTYNERFVELMRFESERAADYFQRAADLLKPEYRRQLIASEIMAAIYFALLQRIKAVRYNVFEYPIRIGRPHKFLLAIRTAFMNRIGVGRTLSK